MLQPHLFVIYDVKKITSLILISQTVNRKTTKTQVSEHQAYVAVVVNIGNQ